MQKYTDTVIKDGKPIQGLAVTVSNYPAGTPATIYATNGAQVPQVLTDTNGRFEFYAPNGHYSLTVSGAGINPYTLNDIVLFDAADNGVGVIKGAGSTGLQALLDAKAPTASPTFAGNVGIGTSTPEVPLHIATPNGTRSFMRMQQVGWRDWYVGIPAGSPRFAITDASAGSERFAIDDTGNVLVGTTSAGCHSFLRDSASDSMDALLQIARRQTGIQSLVAYAVSQDVASSATCAVRMGRAANTLRSLNAGGTINASGADYAEYMTKADDCNVVAPGQIVGIDAGGKLTDKWTAAVSFLIKSTDPSYVGGDTWGNKEALGIDRPVEPVFSVPEYGGAPHPGEAPGDEADDEHRTAYAESLAAYNTDQWAHANTVATARANFAAITLPAYQAELASFEALLEQARQKVDRIAYCGQVPVNVLGATPGQYVVPVQDGDGIGAKPVTKSAMTLGQYLAAVGIVQNILPDGRANVRVKVV